MLTPPPPPPAATHLRALLAGVQDAGQRGVGGGVGRAAGGGAQLVEHLPGWHRGGDKVSWSRGGAACFNSCCALPLLMARRCTAARLGAERRVPCLQGARGDERALVWRDAARALGHRRQARVEGGCMGSKGAASCVLRSAYPLGMISAVVGGTTMPCPMHAGHQLRGSLALAHWCWG